MRVRSIKANRLVAILLTLILCVGDMYIPGFEVFADGEKTVTGLGTGAITDPVGPADADAAWSGSYVYYGKYETSPVKYRVLDTDSGDFGVEGGSVLLDCDSTLVKETFGYLNIWNTSTPNSWLNGTDFLGNTAVFTPNENSAIASSTKAAPASDDGLGYGDFEFAKLSGEKIFLLDAKEATRYNYGFSGSYDNNNRIKSGADTYWWLRTNAGEGSSGCIHYFYVAAVGSDGSIRRIDYSTSCGLSPAFNLSRSAIIFSSLVSGTAGQLGAEYKLTLKDNALSIVPEVALKENNKITIPYKITNIGGATEPNRVSVVVTNGTWTDKGWSAGAELLQYAELEMDSFSMEGSGSFILDSSKVSGKCGMDYHIYVLAEDVNGAKESDYAGIPAEINITTEKILYKVSFDLNGVGAVAIADQDIEEGGKVTEPAAPTADRYTFGGWYKEKECTNKWDFAKDTVTADTILYAKWTKKADPDKPDDPDITVSDNSVSSNKALDPVPEIVPGVTDVLYLVQGQKFDIGPGWYIDKEDADYKTSKKTVNISKKNLFKAKKAGNATITYDSGSAKFKLKIVVSKPLLRDKKIKLQIPEWTTEQIQLSYDKEHLDVFYYSAAPDVVKVDAKTGALTAVGKGKARVSAYINGTAYNCTVTVKESEPAVSRTLHMAVFDTKAVKVKGVKNWSSSAESVAKLTDKKGTKVKALSAGKAVLSAEANGVKYTVDLYAEDLTIKGDKVSAGKKPYNYTIDLKKGESTKLVFAESLDQTVVFKSSNASVAFVDLNGNVTARKTGKCKFTTKIDSKTISITVNVTE